METDFASFLLVGGLWIGIVILILLPPSRDPAIRFKEWTEKKRNK